ncbi:MAG TPA: GMC family oxidoreductase [Solirubrobacteraceae bacterium]|nr:GMC family oxidoreductase [Solirubrobacteraceae bacterium]
MTTSAGQGEFDFDWLVIGSGFGGSVSALRLTDKEYSVGVLECGRRFEDEDFARSTWDARRYLWMPRLGMRGILRLTLFKDVLVASGCGVGGGSLGYASTLYAPPAAFYESPQWSGLADWETLLAPHIAEAERMLGVVSYDREDLADELLRGLGEELGVGDSFRSSRVGIYLGAEGMTVPDPFFGGAGPERTGCVRCAQCMVGCRHGAKNTLVKNYLWFAERGGAEVMPERTVVDIRPLKDGAGRGGYAVTSERSGAWLRKDRRTQTARGVVVAAGTLGTNRLLQQCRLSGSLPRISTRLGERVRTNSESIGAVTANAKDADLSAGVAIGSSIYPDADTHIEAVSYGRGGDSMSLLYTLLTGDGTRFTRPLRLLGQILRHPARFARTLSPVEWSRRTLMVLTMQTTDSAMALRARRRRFGLGVSLQTDQDPERPNPTFIPLANDATERLAQRIGGTAQSSIFEAAANIPSTAHILGGAIIAASPSDGVVDSQLRMFGYENLLVCDGSVVPANPGVNPSLTITALAEHAMSRISPRGSAALPGLAHDEQLALG